MNQEEQARQAFEEGNRLYREGKYEKALQEFSRSLELRPDHPDTLHNRGTTYARMERYPEALADYSRSLELRPDHPDTLNNRGTTYASLERYPEALADYSRSLELRPDHPDTLNNRGITYDRLERYPEALADYNRSLELRPDSPNTLIGRGVARIRSGQAKAALADLSRATRLAPGSALAHFNMAAALLKLDRRAEARRALERALKVDPDFPDAEETLRSLRAPERFEWWAFWFGSDASWRRRAAGGVILGLLLAYVLYSLVPPGALVPVPWGEGRFHLNSGQRWEYYIVPVAVLLALLILPSLGRFRALGIELEPRAPEPQAIRELEPRLSRESSQQPQS